MVASFTDAWIETEKNNLGNGIIEVASFTDAWIETGGTLRPESRYKSRILYGCVD